MGVKITDTTLRDAHQSLMATRLRAADVLPVAGEMDRAGFFSLEAWGGATFDSCIRFLNEDPWERLRTFKEPYPEHAAPDAPPGPEPGGVPPLRR